MKKIVYSMILSLSLAMPVILIASHPDKSHSDQYWLLFNLPPYGSLIESQPGILDLIARRLDKIFADPIKTRRVTPARWFSIMTDENDLQHCSVGSWKLETPHRVYSKPLWIEPGYGIALNKENLGKFGPIKEVISIFQLVDHFSPSDKLAILEGRPIFRDLKPIFEKYKNKVDQVSGSEGANTLIKLVSLKRMAAALVFPAEFKWFVDMNPQYQGKVTFFPLKESKIFSPVRSSCPKNGQGVESIGIIDRLLDQEDFARQIQDDYKRWLPNIEFLLERYQEAQGCIKKGACIDPLGSR